MSLLFEAQANYHRPWSGVIIVIAPEAIPTIDFYITSRLNDGAEVHCYHGDDINHTEFTRRGFSGALVIVVRHASSAAFRMLQQYRNLWSGVAFLMDDDIPGAWRCRDIPLDYALWTTSRYLMAKPSLAALCDRIWVSTPALQARYAEHKTSVVPPLPVGAERSAAKQGCRKWGYHGTRIHAREIDWLVPIVAAVNKAVPEAEFEIFGSARVARLFQGIPRVTVHAPLSWAGYLSYCESTELAVGLAPMLPGRYNAVRSYTKAFDIARCGAVGIFSECDAYAPLAGSVSMLPNHPNGWIDEAIRLLKEDAARIKRYDQFKKWQLNIQHNTGLESLIQTVPN